jgi:hypothetical protein
MIGIYYLLTPWIANRSKQVILFLELPERLQRIEDALFYNTHILHNNSFRLEV